MSKHKCKGPFLLVESPKELFVFYKGQLIHKRWSYTGQSKTFAKYGTKHIESYE